MRINLGAGDAELEGYDNSWDAKQGKKAYPLELPDACADEIRASHLFEHFGHRAAADVLSEWVRVLRPGGLLKIAVPDLEYIARMYLGGLPGQYQGWLCGGQTDQLDVHLAQYDWHALNNLMRACGLVGIHKWPGEHDTSQLPLSLNLGGWKPPAAWPKLAAAMSTPRLGFMDNFACASDACGPLGIRIHRRTGAYWGKCMTLAIQGALETGCNYVLTIDYDTVFTIETLMDLMAFALANPEADALVPVQMNRMHNVVLMSPKRQRTGVFQLEPGEWDVSYYPLAWGHFGCTLFRADAFAKLERPWFTHKPDAQGEWEGAEHLDDDIWFWQQFERAGLNAYLCPRVVVGHLENMIKWPDRNLNTIYQHPTEWNQAGPPRNVWR